MTLNVDYCDVGK